MDDEIINRVTQSNLVTIDLEDFYPEGERVLLDISDWLHGGLVLIEKTFRDKVNSFNWSQYQNNYVALTCSTEAIIPSWAYLLISTYLSPFAKKIVVGDLALLETVIFQEIIQNIDVEIYTGKPIIIKGCSNKTIPETAPVQLVEKLLPFVKTIMFGEACSTVPLFKTKNKN